MTVQRVPAVDDLRIDAIERVVVDTICTGRERGPVACAVIDAASPLADFGRAFEVARFPEYDMAKAMEPFEPASLFLYTIDLEKGRIGHVKRVVKGSTPEEFAETGLTRIEVVDDRLAAADPVETASLEEVFGPFGITDPSTVWNIATSCATERVAPTRHRPYSLLTYKGLLLLTQPMSVEHFFAYVNKKTVRALGRIGIPSSLVGGREFHLPSPDGYDQDYVAIHMDLGPATVKSFTVVDPDRPLSRAVAQTDLPVIVFVDDDEKMSDLVGAAESPHVELVRPMGLDVIDLTDDDLVIDLTSGGGAEITLEGWLTDARR